MHKVTNFIQRHAKSKSTSTTPPPINYATYPGTVSAGTASEEQDRYRYRKQRGVNLGAWFVLERWIAEAPYRAAASPAQSDLDVARGSDAKNILETHWDTWITDTDWAWIAQRGINSVRIPIGYYHICGADPSVLPGTDFADFGNVFAGAWARIVKAIQTAHSYGIGVLIDLHAAPGKQNNDSHSGTSLPPAFFAKKQNMQHAKHVLRVLLSLLMRSPNVIGIELLNEPAPPSDPVLQGWYSDTIRELRSVDPTMPLYIGECWRAENYAGYISGLPQTTATFVALDHHLYRCFTKEDIHISALQHARNMADANGTAGMFARVSEKLGGGLVVGEWSGALNPGSLRGSHDPAGDQRQFVSAQLELFEKYCAGYFFWTYKKQNRGDKGWSFRDAVEGGTFPSWVGLKARRSCIGDEQSRQGRRSNLRDKALATHTAYWSQYPGHYEHWRLSEGFVVGWDDAYWFLSSAGVHPGGPVPELGFKGAWGKRRAAEHAQHKGADCLWEFEHGLKQGIDAARKDFEDNYC